MKRILLAYDGSPGAEAALSDLKRAGLPPEAEGRVLAIADVWLPPNQAEGEPALPGSVSESSNDSRTRALSALQAARDISNDGAGKLQSLFPGWRVTAAGHADSPAWGILAEARRWRADLIVVGSHGRSMLQRFFLGSVSQKVVAEASCSVRVFRPHERHGTEPRILIAMDGSSDSRAAIEEVIGRTWPGGTLFHLLTVVDPKLSSVPAALFRDEWQNASDTGTEWVGRMLTQQTELMRKNGMNVETHVFDGDPKSILLDHAERWKAETIFLGARGLQHGDRLYLGTFASAIATRAPCPVEIVRPANHPPTA